MNYNHREIEKKWQKFWAEKKTFKAENNSKKTKFYVLDMFPYPSGAGLHIGHPLGYIASDIFARYKRHKGFNVLHPQGYDSFGLPAEQYAIQTGQHPAITTKQNIERYREQLDKIGFSFDWEREVRTSDPKFYRWTQWIFSLLFDCWYNKTSDKAEPISSLIEIFEKQGNAQVNAQMDEDTPSFTKEQWRDFSSKEKQQILMKYRIAYLAETQVNWCPKLGTVLANDEIVNGLSERGGYPVVRKKMTQWSMRISAYAHRLLKGLDSLNWSDAVKESQRNWIGKSQGASVFFSCQGYEIEVFTTRPDTIFGVTYITLAPEHELVEKITTEGQRKQVQDYVRQTSMRSERERMAEVETVSGVFTGAYASHPITKEKIPVWIGDYVLAGYATAAVMAVPCADQRDYAFAKHFSLPIKNITGKDISQCAYTEKGEMVYENSDFLNGYDDFEKAKKAVIDHLQSTGKGKEKTTYRLRDAVFSRQRYWGEPFPVYYKEEMPQIISPQFYPITLPEVEKYLPTEQGQPPLGNATAWGWDTKQNKIVENTKIDNKSVFPMELNTMPGWAGSSWYWIRYMDAQNQMEFSSQDNIKYWRSVDLYVGGSEHATGHLLYSRFWNMFLKDIGLVEEEEPFKKLVNQGMILGQSAFVYREENTNKFISKNLVEDKKVTPIHVDISLLKESGDELDIEKFKAWRPEFKNAEFTLENGKYICAREVEKMSKSKYNVINPDDICQDYGADTLRLYEMFLGPVEQAKPWGTSGISGVQNFLRKLWRLYFGQDGFDVTDQRPTQDMYKTLHKTIKKVVEDIENFSFNTSVAQFMICVNELSAQKCHHKDILEPLTVLISPFAPHIAEELWQRLGHKQSIEYEPYPTFEEKYLVENEKQYPVSFNGKVKFKKTFPLDMTQDQIEKEILQDPQTKQILQGAQIKKIIVVKGKIINVVM